MNEHIADLIIQSLQGELTPGQQAELEEWMTESESHRQTVEAFLQEAALARGIRDHWVEDRIWQRLNQLIDMDQSQESTPIRHMDWRRYAAVAAIVVVVGGAYFLLSKSAIKHSELTQVPAKRDVPAPTRARAVITLANGKEISLDSASEGTMANQGLVQVVKLADGQLAYTGQDKEVFYNTLTNPRGSKVIALTLPDGTKVWLNAASALHFPTAFIGSTRTVEIAGEAYFEIAKNVKMPFIVKKGKTELTVLGTSFNINSYDDENATKITLIDGSVRINMAPVAESSDQRRRNQKHKEIDVILKPGQQAQLAVGVNTNSDQIKVLNDVDAEAVLAWKNGRFQFDGASIQEVMRELARWYNVDIVYEGIPKEQHFRGGIPRSVDVTKVFKMLETTGVVNFVIKDKKIIVMP